MSRKLFLVVTTIVFCGLGTIFSPKPARAEVTLSKATIQELVREARLMRENQAPRTAKLRDLMTTGDALSTARSARAALRFNDGSLARVGELALFRFTAGTRNFRLSNGTVLLLIPPGRGRTKVNTPNASAGIRGSALFVRYDAATDTTIIGALTDNPDGPMDISSRNGQQQELKSGQMVIIVKDQIQKLYEFDLKTFYETSELVRGLDLTKENGANADGDIAAVQGETSEAFQKQSKDPFQGEGVIQGKFVSLSPIDSDFYQEPSQSVATQDGIKPSVSNPLGDNLGDLRPTVSTGDSINSGQSSNPVPPVPPVPNPEPPTITPTPAPPEPSVQTPTPGPTQAPVAPPTQQNQPPQSIPNPPPAIQAPSPVTPPVQAPAPAPVQAPVTPPVAPTPAPVQAPVAPPVQAPTPPVQAPVTPPVQAPISPPVRTPVTPPVQPPVQAPISPPVQTPTPAPTIIPTPTQAPVVPPTQQNNPPAPVQQTPAVRSPQITPTLAPALAPSATPESPATTGQVQQPVR
ncbi:FecR domain-containing protein [Phormidesmis sp. 146-12]